MRSALKHITAGPLNVRAIGQVPDHETFRPRRSAKSQQTNPAQQFYNNKLSWRELELVIATNFGKNDYFVTYTYDESNLPANKEAAANELKKHFRRVRDIRKRRGQELKYIYVTEGFHEQTKNEHFEDDSEKEHCRWHHHVVLNCSSESEIIEIQSLWSHGFVRFEPVNPRRYTELAKYMTKEARDFGRPKPGERTWRASRNLQRYEVEYIDIPFDGISLTAPPGAIDYISEHEKNPYGFSNIQWDRYLFFPDEPEKECSYTAGRRKRE